VTTPAGVDLYSVQEGEKRPELNFRQTIPPPEVDVNPVVFRSARYVQFFPPRTHRLIVILRFTRAVSTTPSSPPPTILHCILNTRPQPKQRSKKPGQKRPASQEKSYACNLSPGKLSAAAPQSDASKDAPRPDAALGKWEVVARRDVGNRPVTAMQIR
jgi:hypothetical protein